MDKKDLIRASEEDEARQVARIVAKNNSGWESIDFTTKGWVVFRGKAYSPVDVAKALESFDKANGNQIDGQP